MGTFRFYSQETEGKGKRNIGHRKLEQHVHDVLQGIDSDAMGEENTCFEVLLNCKVIRNCKKVVICLEVRCAEKKMIDHRDLRC